MGWTQVGNCPKCGAPLYSPTAWWSVNPPPVSRSCACFPEFTTAVTDSTNVNVFMGRKLVSKAVVDMTTAERKLAFYAGWGERVIWWALTQQAFMLAFEDALEDLGDEGPPQTG